MDKVLTNKIFYGANGKPFLQLNKGQKEAVAIFNERVRSGEVLFENCVCLCQGAEFSLLATIDRYGMLQTTVICKQCGLVQSNPRMIKEAYMHFYTTDEYRRLYDSDDFLDRCVRLYDDPRRGKAILDIVSRYKPIAEMQSVLEIGAAGGWNIYPFMQAGCKVRGYDFSEELVAFGRKKGIDLVCGDVFAVEGVYDVIILNHVIEHFTDFLVEMKCVRTHLADGGILFVAVPNIKHFNIAMLQNAHTYYFSQKTLRYYLQQCGFCIIHEQDGPLGVTHMSAVCVVAAEENESSLIEGHYREVVRMLRSRFGFLYRVRRACVRVLDFFRVKAFVRSLIYGANSGRVGK